MMPGQEIETEAFSFETPSVNERGEIVERRPGTGRLYKETLWGGIILEMVAIPGGMFQMGSAGHMGYRLCGAFLFGPV
jgi:formylglycine-generating enzyme required for sulfatase activity